MASISADCPGTWVYATSGCDRQRESLLAVGLYFLFARSFSRGAFCFAANILSAASCPAITNRVRSKGVLGVWAIRDVKKNATLIVGLLPWTAQQCGAWSVSGSSLAGQSRAIGLPLCMGAASCRSPPSAVSAATSAEPSGLLHGLLPSQLAINPRCLLDRFTRPGASAATVHVPTWLRQCLSTCGSRPP